METTKWKLEPSHSELEFQIRHMMISNVVGHFRKFDATAEVDGDDFTTSNIDFTADIDSIDTNNAQRDGHLKSADFFDMERFPQIQLAGARLEKTGAEKYRLYGNLTMHGVTKPVTLDVTYGGTVKDPWGNMRSGFMAEGRLNRKDYGLNWNQLTETGGLVASDEVLVRANLEFIKSKEKEMPGEQHLAAAA